MIEDYEVKINSIDEESNCKTCKYCEKELLYDNNNEKVFRYNCTRYNKNLGIYDENAEFLIPEWCRLIKYTLTDIEKQLIEDWSRLHRFVTL